ncbi:MAG: formate hydrogenlyase subunit 3/multisubunit Na+/H+ antiporter MnhD subunit [Rhodoferax sp.]|jgi:formate hydrogenlyase subunit 3/multisubunit Na+/H+ antiporter MnhD subunit
MKYLVIFTFVAILASLSAALFYMMNNQGQEKSRGQKMAFALALRVGLSILLFVCIVLAWHFGYIQPTGIRPGQ